MSTSLINFSQAVLPALFLSLSNPARVEILTQFQNDIVENIFGPNLETTDDNTNMDFSLSLSLCFKCLRTWAQSLLFQLIAAPGGEIF